MDVAGAQALAAQDRYQFQWWALSLVNALPAGDEQKKGADTGIDGVIGFVEEKGQGGAGNRVGEERARDGVAGARLEGRGRAREGGDGAVHHAGAADAADAHRGGQRGVLPLGAVGQGLSRRCRS